MIRNRIGWALWLAGALAVYLFENRGATLAVLLASLLVPALSLAAALLAAGRCRGELQLPESATRGETVTCRLRVLGPALPAVVSGHMVCVNGLTGEEQSLAVSSHGGGTVSFRIRLHHCGTVHIRGELQVRDWFGLWVSPPLPCEEMRLRVEPVLFDPLVVLTATESSQMEGERYSSTRPGADPSEMFGIREYRPGDPIRQIHWKLSMKTEETMLREMGAPVVDRLLLLLDIARPGVLGPQVSDACAQVFLSISRRLAEEGVLHTLGWCAPQGGSVTREVGDMESWAQAEEAVLELTWNPEAENVARCFRDFCSGEDHAHVAVVAPAFPEGAELLSRGGRVTVLAADVPEFAPGGIWLQAFPVPGWEEALEQVIL